LCFMETSQANAISSSRLAIGSSALSLEPFQYQRMAVITTLPRHPIKCNRKTCEGKRPFFGVDRMRLMWLELQSRRKTATIDQCF